MVKNVKYPMLAILGFAVVITNNINQFFNDIFGGDVIAMLIFLGVIFLVLYDSGIFKGFR